MLHIITTSTGQALIFERIGQGDAVLFIEDAVLCLHKNRLDADDLLARCQSLDCYVLEPDLQLRGLAQDEVIPGIVGVDYPGFVDLTVAHDVIKTWN